MPELRSAAALNRVTELFIGAGIEVHREYGAGLLESAYLPPLERAIVARGLTVEKECAINRQALKPVARRYRADLVVEKSVVIEVKAIDRILPVHAAQLRTYLRLSGCPVGLILNFNSALLKDGIKRVVHDFPDDFDGEAMRKQRR